MNMFFPILNRFSCNLEDIIQRIEWTTLIFFGSMFVAMECLARLGLINFVGKQTENLIFLVDAKYQLALAIVLVLGVRNRNLFCSSQNFTCVNSHFH